MELNNYTHRKFFAEFEPLLHRVLRDAYIDYDYLFYDDLLQELRLKLLAIAKKFDGQPLGEDRYRFVAYCRQGLMWYLRDILPKFRLQCVGEIDSLPPSSWINDNSSTRASLLNFLEEAKKLLSDDEFLLLRLSGLEDYTIKDLSKIFQCSRQTIYKRREKIAEKLLHLKELLN